MPARKACAMLPSMSMSPSKYASRNPTWPKSSTRRAARPLRMSIVTSGARSRFCQDEPSVKTTRKQTSVLAPISSIVFLNWEFMIPVGRWCLSGEGDLDIFSRNFEAPSILIVSWAVDPSCRTLMNFRRFLLSAVLLATPCAQAQTASPPTTDQALFRSIENGDFLEFSRLVEAGADLSVKNKLGETLLYFAAEKGETEMARLLIAKGADAKARTPSGETVLHAAAMIESMSLMAGLIKAGAELDAVNQDGETALQWAALTGTFLAVKA